MSTKFNIASLSRAAALSLALVPAIAGLTTAARADDEYGTNRSPSILQSAQSAFVAKSETPLAVATAQAHVVSSPVATTAGVPPVSGANDLVGQGGQQDSFARGEFHPGSGTDW